MKGKSSKDCRAKGGRIGMKVSGNPDVFKEAEERKRGGKVEHHKRKKEHHLGKIEGEHARHRMDRPHRKSGGRVGADRHPFSSAHSTTSASKSPD